MQNVGKNDPRGNDIVGSGELFCSKGCNKSLEDGSSGLFYKLSLTCPMSI